MTRPSSPRSKQVRRRDQAIDPLHKQGRYNAAHNLSKGVYADRKAKPDAATAELARQEKALGFASQIAASATDQKSWTVRSTPSRRSISGRRSCR